MTITTYRDEEQFSSNDDFSENLEYILKHFMEWCRLRFMYINKFLISLSLIAKLSISSIPRIYNIQ